MALQTSGAITLADIQTEFGGANPIGLNEYYAGGTYVPSGTSGTNGAVPSSGTISLWNFFGTSKYRVLQNPNAYGTSAYDHFGTSVSISGNYAIVGAPSEDDAGGLSSGKAYIFNVTTGALVHTLNNPNAYGTSADDQFGFAAAISGNYAIVSAYENDAGGSISGKAYVFNATTGALLWTLNNPNVYGTSANDFFGVRVAISGNYAIVGAPYEDDAGGLDSGKAYIFNVTNGALVHTLSNPNAYGTSAYDHFPESVAISGNYAIAGVTYEEELASPIILADANAAVSNWVANGIYSGSNALIIEQTAVVSDASAYSYITTGPTTATVTGIAYVAPNKTGLTQVVAELALDNDSQDDSNFNVSPPWNTTFLGTSYAAIYYGSNGYLTFGSGSTAYSNLDYISIPRIHILAQDDANLGLWVGTTGTAPNRVHRIVVKSEFDAYLKTSVGNTIVWYEIRLYENQKNRVDVHHDILSKPLLASYSGKAYVFNVTTGAHLRTISNPNAYGTPTNDFFGYSVAVSGNYAIVSALNEDSADGGDSGKAYIFNVTNGALVHTLSNPNAYGTPTNDEFGHSLAISGNYAIVGAWGEDDAGGGDSGKAYIFNITTGALVRTLDNPNAYSTQSDNFSRAVAISDSHAIVGAPYEDDVVELSSGKAYIFGL